MCTTQNYHTKLSKQLVIDLLLSWPATIHVFSMLMRFLLTLCVYP